MKAVVCYDFGESAVEEIPRPDPDPTEVLVEVHQVQLSVTECSLYRGEEITHYEAITSRLGPDGAKLFGHEFCGQVVETGEEVTEFDTGDRVYAPGKIPCLECASCEAGYTHLCHDKDNIGYERPGALAEYVTVPAHPLETLSDGISDAEGAAMQPFSTSVLSVHDAEIETGDVVVAVGMGVIGAQCAQLALRQGASTVFGVDIVDEKLTLAESYGVESIDAREEDPVERIVAATDGIGADVAFEAVGGSQDRLTDGDGPITQAFRALRTGGTLVQVGHIAGDVSATARDLRDKCLTWRHPLRGNPQLGPNASPGEVAPELVDDGLVTIDDHITHELDGLSSFERAVEMTLNKEEYGALGPAQIVVD
ncbi:MULTISPECIES: zinc-binding dehydrogenase [Halorussus]|uniref:zinc-dependent alcohol dehydrogenase n=1 Tax=Halorussus TaxID=1070314 RepID=UPI000E20D223|nr:MULTISPECIES: alcohol dehydrogenase catalytic domain-containing protein [Halorussus]NHN61559.1 alcohol dehydrogenase catalytic domain-containing protein [Halorussus sp. JP-T4]